jgi:RHS repeat-associated protein
MPILYRAGFNDAVASSGYDLDLRNQTNPNNYQYDGIGNIISDAQSGITKIGWTVYNKPDTIYKSAGNITYNYNTANQRVSKTYNGLTTWYVRDAQGNVLSVYDNADSTVNWREQHLYGSSRLGMWKPNMNLADSNAVDIWDTTGYRLFELNNHLGNVMTTINDVRNPYFKPSHIGPLPGPLQYFTANVLSYQDYYAFGMLMPDRQYTNGDSTYRYGFNGKEQDNEIMGYGNSQDYGERFYDPRVGRFLSVDPLTVKYPELTPYQFASNRPIDGIDLDGKEWENIKSKWIVYSKGASALPIIKSDNGSGYLLKATYGLQDKTSKENFDKLKTAYLTNPGIIHNPNNGYAQYYPIKTDSKSKTLSVGDNMYIDITGPFNDYVRFTDIKVTDNTFYIKAATLYGHTDAGFIVFSGSFDPTTGIANFSIYNETTNNLGMDALNPRSIGRGAQKAQWELVLNNVASFLKGNVKSKTLKTELSIQNAQKGDAVKVATEDLQSGKTTEELKEKQ